MRPNRTKNGSQEPVLVRFSFGFFRFRELDFKTLFIPLFLWLKKHRALVDAASLLVLQQTIVTVPERPHPVLKLRALPARVSLPLPPSFIHLVKFLHKESDKEQI
jgi:hypothetical protein